MGKPYGQELSLLNETYQWALKAPIDGLLSFVDSSHGLPLLAVGSGGSLTAAHMAALLHQNTGMIGKAITPLELISCRNSLRSSSIMILSARGSNPDILSAFHLAAACEPRQLASICMRRESPLERYSKEYHYTQCYGFSPPFGKDGFLATNSLLALITILCRGYGETASFPELLPGVPEDLNTAAKQVLKRKTLIVLYGGWGLPAAVDLESKLTEAALQQVQQSDYRNFAHGRHHWLAKRGSESGIVALVSPWEEALAKKTLHILPKDIPVLRLATHEVGPVGAIELIVQAMHLVRVQGELRGIDPGRPGVPTFGRRVYHLRALQKEVSALTQSDLDSRRSMAILRKSGYTSLVQLSTQESSYWGKAYYDYLHGLEHNGFGALVFDYDGTLCDPAGRFSRPPEDIMQSLVHLLEAGIIVGIATGRGQSVRVSLQSTIPHQYWEQVLIGYYNGSAIGLLGDSRQPDKSGTPHPSLELIKTCLERDPRIESLFSYEIRPNQITVTPVQSTFLERTRAVLADIVFRINALGVRILESSHSMDIIAPGVSKLNLVNACSKLAEQSNRPACALTIGDRGRWPGNDFELLSVPFSLSVDEVSPDPKSCWNIASPGYRGVQATLEYLDCISVDGSVVHFHTGLTGNTES
jgi:hypothetical protein